MKPARIRVSFLIDETDADTLRALKFLGELHPSPALGSLAGEVFRRSLHKMLEADGDLRDRVGRLKLARERHQEEKERGGRLRLVR